MEDQIKEFAKFLEKSYQRHYELYSKNSAVTDYASEEALAMSIAYGSALEVFRNMFLESPSSPRKGA